MANPLFVDTSMGHVNLAKVKWVVRVDGKMRFIFTNLVGLDEGGIIQREYLDFDLKEGEQIMQRLRDYLPDLFVAG
jgi:hypothetical protein